MRMRDLVRPPAARPPTPDWIAVEQALGTSLPSDYKDLAATYGSGEFAEHLGLLHPLAPRETKNLILAQEWLASTLRLLVGPVGEDDSMADLTPAWVKQAEGALLACMVGRNAEAIYWRTDRANPDLWTIVVVDREPEEYAHYPLGLEEFLVQLLTGKLICHVLPDDLHETPSFKPYSWPLEQL